MTDKTAPGQGVSRQQYLHAVRTEILPAMLAILKAVWTGRPSPKDGSTEGPR
ncbi:hypothetical protein ACFWXO_43010 [Kitasatospora sp. NPDC059088]|uniref:hypothetical protein n=1 Tax=Kitasatospora sp. NPDC059088 TaxID=3346722 RepID=UPI0036A4A46A